MKIHLFICFFFFIFRPSGCLSTLIPRLWPFLYHSNVTVRRSTLETILTLTAQSTSETCQISKCDNDSCSNNKSCDVYMVPDKDVSSVCKSESDDFKDSSGSDKDIDAEMSIVEDIDYIPNDKSLNAKETLTSQDMDVEHGRSTDESDWIVTILKELLTHMYQRALLESSIDNLNLITKIWDQVLACVPLSNLLMIICPVVSSWLCLIMINPRQPLDSSLLLLAHHNNSGGLKKHPGISSENADDVKPDTKYFLGSLTSIGEVQENPDIVIRSRLSGARLLGSLSHYITQPMPGAQYSSDQDPVLCYNRLLVSHLASRSALQRIGAGIVIREWAIHWPDTIFHEVLKSALHSCLLEMVYFDEIAMSFTRLQQDVKDFIALMKHYKLEVDESFLSPVLTLEQIKNLCTNIAPKLFSSVKLRPKVHQNLESRRKTIQSNSLQTSTEQITLTTTTLAVLSGATICTKILPEKLNPIIKPLMDSIKKEQNEQFQKMSARDLTRLIKQCITRIPCPNNKVIKNLSTYLCVDPTVTPHVISENKLTLTDKEKFSLIYILRQRQKANEQKFLQRSSSKTDKASSEENAESRVVATTAENNKENEIQRRGCTMALRMIIEYFGKSLPEDVSQLWSLIVSPLTTYSSDDTLKVSDEKSQEIINWLQLIEVLVPVLHQDLIIEITKLIEEFGKWLYDDYSAVRHMTARVISELAAVNPVPTLTYVTESVLPVLNLIDQDSCRKGAVECLYFIVDKLGFEIVPYIVFLIVPLLGRNGDPNECVRLLSTQCFASLLRLLPLEGGVPDPPSLGAQMLEKKAKERVFLDQLLNFNKAEDYKIPIPVNAELRSYQQEGVNWLAFLNRYQLHGILCDDMGLGKTLQSICILAGEHFKLSSKSSHEKSIPSLVICPPTLTGHWVYEVEKFVSKEYLNPLHYTGGPPERMKLRQYFSRHNLIIASYDIVRNEVDFFSKTRWNYIILDEGHMIKNGKTKSSKAVKQLIANHRLILSGTPIQNNVLELWSLFDFLIPGFLGTEKQFIAQYSKPILQSRDPKSTSREQEAGVLAMESLHRQVLPFILRRVKEDVLKDLPPKITQDYYCQLSPLQKQLYEDFARTRVKQNIVDSLNNKDTGEDTGSNSKPHSHIFQALQYLRRVCNHPKLVVKPQHPEYPKIIEQLKEQKTNLNDINHSAKLPALK